MIPSEIGALVARGATFFVNHSAGKDSQAMFHFIRKHVPNEQIVIIHAVLPEVEWDGVIEHIQATTLGRPIIYAQARRTLLQMVEERGMFPSPQQRQCTSDLKRGPIEREIRRWCKANGRHLVVNCMGMRAQESASRSKLTAFKLHEGNSKAGREWYDWLPIHHLTVDEVFAIIRDAGQEPHWAYAAGMTRLSCVMCIMASEQDLKTAARLNPTLYRRYVDLERRIGRTMLMPSKTKGRRTLEDVTGIAA